MYLYNSVFTVLGVFVYYICTLCKYPSSVDVLGKFRSFDRPEFQTSWHRLPDCPLAP